jgi:hypothetical protein
LNEKQGTYELSTINNNFVFSRIYIRQHPLPPLGKRGETQWYHTLARGGRGC